uniref:hypothetical protein n=1 Tax=Pseudomonas aeruginosa TaxID=287 RepID=UPI000ADACDEF|nr:hypothetical protein [Pseudomonas aeruginosa]
MNRQQALALRQWIRELNQLGVRYGYEDMAGPPPTILTLSMSSTLMLAKHPPR